MSIRVQQQFDESLKGFALTQGNIFARLRVVICDFFPGGLNPFQMVVQVLKCWETHQELEHLKDCISTVFAALFDIWWENFLETILLWTYFAAAEILLSKHKLNSGQLLKNQKISFASQFMCNPTVLHKLPFNLFQWRWNNNFQDFLKINDQSVNWKPFAILLKLEHTFH